MTESNSLKKSRLLIIGAGGFGREVLMVLRSLDEDDAVLEQYQFGGFLDDGDSDEEVLHRIGAEHVGSIANLQSTDGYVISVARPHTRLMIQQRLDAVGAAPVVLVHRTAWIGDDVELGDGTIVTAQCSLTTNIRLGSHVHVNLGCTIGHDAILEDYVTLSPGVHVSGNVHIKPGGLVGTGAVLLPGVTIGRGAVVGAGAVVTKDVQDNVVAIGSPAKSLKSIDAFPELKPNRDFSSN